VLLGFLPFQKMGLLAKACSIMPGFVYQYAREQAETYGLEPKHKEKPWGLLYALMYHFPDERVAYRHLTPFEFGSEWESAEFGLQYKAGLNSLYNCISEVEDEEGQVYTWGYGSGGLGHGDQLNRKFPTKVEALRGKKAREVKMGFEHTVVLMRNGDVYGWGRNDQGQLGLGVESELVLRPQLLKWFQENGLRVVHIKVGLSSTFFLTSEGRLFATGANTSGCFGPCSTMGQNYEPIKYCEPREMMHPDIKCKVLAVDVRKNSTRVYALSQGDNGESTQKRRKK